jgi:ammonium transporter, Amt family
VFGIHGVGGMIGAILTGVFSRKAISGADASLLTQTIGAFSTLGYSATMSFLILLPIKYTIGLRVEPEQEYTGLDLAQHGEQIP